MLLDWDTEHPARSLAVEVFALTEGLEGDFFAGEPREERGKAALTELFETVRSGSTPIIVEKVVEEIDNVVRQVRFDGWQSTSEGAERFADNCDLFSSFNPYGRLASNASYYWFCECL